MKVDPYKVGEIITNLTILEMVSLGVNQSETKYKVRYNCCGASNIISHKRIRARITDRAIACTRCSNKEINKVENRHNHVQIDWAPPGRV